MSLNPAVNSCSNVEFSIALKSAICYEASFLGQQENSC